MSDIGNKDVFARNLTYYVEQSGKTRGEICKELGIAYSTFSEWINARKYPRIDKIEQLASYFGILKSQLIENTQATATECSPQMETAPFYPDQMTPIPVIGKVAAGYTCLAEQYIEGYALADPESMTDGYEYFWLRVTGDSMEPDIQEGDLVLVRVQETVESGDCAVVLVDEEDGLVKNIEIGRDHVTLYSKNPSYPPRVFVREDANRVRIVGKVVELKRAI